MGASKQLALPPDPGRPLSLTQLTIERFRSFTLLGKRLRQLFVPAPLQLYILAPRHPGERHPGMRGLHPLIGLNELIHTWRNAKGAG